MHGRKRLHISPLSAELLPTVLNPLLLQQASNISFHTIETFPEKNYGYIDLPDMEADKLKKKLKGSLLKGTKMRVEEARPKKATAYDGDDGASEGNGKMRRSKKAKVREEGVIPGHELRDRKVKRGWTEPASDDVKSSKKGKDKDGRKPKKRKASLTGEVECLFKTTLPPNATAAADLKDGKVKKRKQGDSSRDVVVHEFTNTTKHPSFLRDKLGANGKKGVSEYVEGRGWVDTDGNILETEPKRRRRKTKPAEEEEVPAKEEAKPRSRRSSRLEAPSVQIIAPKTRRAREEVVEDETSSSGSSSSKDSESEAEASEPSPPPKKATASSPKQKQNGLGISGAEDDGVSTNQVQRLSITRSSATPPPSQSIAPTSAPAQPSTEVHPLEALFKRPNTAASASLTPKKPNLEVSTSFSFFDPDIDEGGSQSTLMPQTPFTQQDIRHRRQRSAAPTPDTAMPGKTFGDVWEGTSDIDDDDEEDVEMEGRLQDKATPEIKEEKQESEFSKWFWEHRGETNRAWKRRRREAAKDKRQKDNKERRG